MSGYSQYQGTSTHSDTFLRDHSNNLSMADLQRIFQLKQEELEKNGSITNFKLSNHYMEIIFGIIILFIGYQIYIKGYMAASITFIIVFFYMLFYYSRYNYTSLDHEVAWTDCPDYFVKVDKEGSLYDCVNISPEYVPGPGYDQINIIENIDASATRKDICNTIAGFKGLSWEWCDDPRNH